MRRSLLALIFDLAKAMQLPREECLWRLGDHSGEVRINDEAYWSDIPMTAWEFTIGGRKVLAKWLSYRDFRVVNRPLSVREM
jgi:hypothetical protein